MNIEISEKHLPVYEALASKVRLKIIQLLTERQMNVKELADSLDLSSAIMTMHVKKLELAGIIRSEMIPGKGGTKKQCSLQLDNIEIAFPSKQDKMRLFHQTEISVGHYSDFDIKPTCGICTWEKVIGIFDDPRYFLDPERFNAKILWFGQGYVEYRIPNFLLGSENPEELEISMEIASEAPLVNNNWPSDISFFLNDVKLGTWTSPGDFGGNRGKLNPDWWYPDINQYGLLKRLKITKDGTYMDGLKLSQVNIDELDLRLSQWKLRIGVLEDAPHVGGVTLFGSGFGNYNQDIVLKLFYKKTLPPLLRPKIMNVKKDVNVSC
jgi:predicted transcriptional regulator